MRSGGRRQIDEIDCLGSPIQFFFDDRPAAPCQRIGHYQWPCIHSPALIMIYLQYRIFATMADAIQCVPMLPGSNLSRRGLRRSRPTLWLFGAPRLRSGLRLPLVGEIIE